MVNPITCSLSGELFLKYVSFIYYHYFFFSLPRPKLTVVPQQQQPQQKHHKVREFSYKIDLDGLKRMKRAKSLEHMLDSGSSSTFSAGSSNLGPNVWVAADNKGLKKNIRGTATLGRSHKLHPNGGGRTQQQQQQQQQQQKQQQQQPRIMAQSGSQGRLNKILLQPQQSGNSSSSSGSGNSSRSPGSALRKQYHQQQQQQQQSQYQQQQQQQQQSQYQQQQIILDANSLDYHQRLSDRQQQQQQQQQHDVPSYCTIDRSRLRRRQKENQHLLGVNSPHLQTQTLPRKPKRTPSLNAGPTLVSRPTIRSRSVEILDRDPVSCERAIEDEFKSSNFEKTFPSGGDLYGMSTTYIGDAGIDELRRVTSEYILDKGSSSSGTAAAGTLQHGKSVTIHPNVTEFHYPGEEIGLNTEKELSISRKNIRRKKLLWGKVEAETQIGLE